MKQATMKQVIDSLLRGKGDLNVIVGPVMLAR
jgi:hypothetical protein